MNRNPWPMILLFCAVVWLLVVVALYMAAGCSVDAPC